MGGSQPSLRALWDEASAGFSSQEGGTPRVASEQRHGAGRCSQAPSGGSGNRSGERSRRPGPRLLLVQTDDVGWTQVR